MKELTAHYVKKKWNKRSGNQNRYMWLCFEEIASYTGYGSEEVHTLCKGLYCPRLNVKMGDGVLPYPQRYFKTY